MESLTVGGENFEAQKGPLTFFDDEINDQHHDDDLVISIHLANCEVKMVLIDPGSSVKEMNMESAMSYYPTTLVFGNGAADKSMVVVNLATYAAGIN